MRGWTGNKIAGGEPAVAEVGCALIDMSTTTSIVEPGRKVTIQQSTREKIEDDTPQMED